MRRTVIAGLSLVLMLGAMVPASHADPASFSGQGSARALDLSIPALNQFPDLAAVFKGLTLGHTSASFTSAPEAKGYASGDCELLKSTGFEGIPCAKGTFEDSSTPADLEDGVATCVINQTITVVGLRNSCGNSSSRIEGGKPVSLNAGGVAAVGVSVDLNALGLATYLEDNKDQVVDLLASLLSDVFRIVTGEQRTELEEALGEFLNSVKAGGQFASITVGDATTNVTNLGDVTTITSAASGGRVGLLGLTDALKDGLITVEVSSGSATASIDGVKAATSASAVAALAKVRFRDLLDLDPASDYIVAEIDPVDINGLLSPLNGTPLETTVEMAKTTQSATAASSTGVGIRALKGVGESSAGKKDGGLTLRLAAAEVSVNAVLNVRIQQPLPLTGGPTYLYWVAAAILAIGAPLLIRVARRLRTTA